MIAKARCSTDAYETYPQRPVEASSRIDKGDVVLILKHIDLARKISEYGVYSEYYVPVFWRDQVVFVFHDDLGPVEEEDAGV